MSVSDHLNGTNHFWEFVQFLNQHYSGTALVYQDALVICRQCGSWKIVPQKSRGKPAKQTGFI